jgi:hypothetical protein
MLFNHNRHPQCKAQQEACTQGVTVLLRYMSTCGSLIAPAGLRLLLFSW